MNEQPVDMTKTKVRSDFHYILLLPFIGAVIATSTVFVITGGAGFDYLWCRVTPVAVGVLTFGSLVVVVAILYLARAIFRFIERT